MTYTNRQMIRDLWSYIKPYKTRFWIGTFFRASSDFMWLVAPWIFSEVINFVSTYTAGASLTYLYQLGALAAPKVLDTVS